MRPEWFPNWSGQSCVIVGSGESANAETVAKCNGKCRVLVINTSYRLAPCADVLYACDGKWWIEYKGVPEFWGLKVTQDKEAAERFGINKIGLLDLNDPKANLITVAKAGLVARGGFGGFQAVNLAIQFGSRRIGLIGFDFVGGHWHGNHPNGLRNPRAGSLERWRVDFDAQAPRFTELGVEIINLSPVSRATAYPKMKIDEFLDAARV